MKHPRDRGLVRSPRRVSGQAVRRFAIICTIAAFGNVSGMADSPLENNPTRSISGQFIIPRPQQTPSRTGTATNFVRLEPALLAVSAERIKDLVWHKLDIKGPWRGQIYLVLHRAQSPDEAVTIRSQPFNGGWNYRVELPDVVLPTRFVRAMTGVGRLD